MKVSFAAVLLLAWIAGAMAEPLFVSDKLIVTVYAEANQDSDKVAVLESGDAIEGVEKGEGFTRVRLADGRNGWLKSSYLTAQAPAIVRLKQLEKERAAISTAPSPQLAEQLERVEAENAALHGEIGALKQATAQQKVTTRIVRDEAFPPVRVLEWGGALLLASGGVGFVLGYRTLAGRIRRKYGALRIY